MLSYAVREENMNNYHLIAAVRYIDLNPVRAGLAGEAARC